MTGFFDAARSSLPFASTRHAHAAPNLTEAERRRRDARLPERCRTHRATHAPAGARRSSSRHVRFSRITNSAVSCLLMIRRMRRFATVLARHGGEFCARKRTTSSTFDSPPKPAGAGSLAELAKITPRSRPKIIFLRDRHRLGDVLCLSECNVHGHEVNTRLRSAKTWRRTASSAHRSRPRRAAPPPYARTRRCLAA